MRAALAVGLVLLPAALAAGEHAARGLIGTAIEFDRRSERHGPGAWIKDPHRQPFANPELHGLGLREVRQGQDVYRWLERPLYIVHNYFCSSTAYGATVPDRCDAVAFVLRPPPAGAPNEQYAGELGRVEGDFGSIEPHPTLPLFATILVGWSDRGWSDEHALVAVHDLAGRALCPPAPIDLAPADADVWAKLPVAGAWLTCPGGRRVEVPAWDSEERE